MMINHNNVCNNNSLLLDKSNLIFVMDINAHVHHKIFPDCT